MKKYITIGIIILVLAFVSTLIGYSEENEVSTMGQTSDVNKLMDTIGIDQSFDEVIKKALFSYKINESYNLYVVNDSIHTENENVLIFKKTNGKIEKVEKFEFDSHGNDIEGTEIYKIRKIDVQQSKQNETVYVYIFREGQLYEGVDILILSNEMIDKKWIYRDKQTPSNMFGYTEYEYLLDQQILHIYDKNTQNAKQVVKEKEELINSYSQKLSNEYNLKVMYGDFLDEDLYVYIVENEAYNQEQQIHIVYLNEGNVECKFKGSCYKQIYKLSINQLKDSENPNVCVFEKNEMYTKVQIYQIIKNNERGIVVHNIGSCKKDNKTGEYSGDESYKYVLDTDFPYDYQKQSNLTN